jgi:hypothetical protein
MSQTAHLSPLGARIILIGLALLVVWGIWRPLPRQGAAVDDDRTDSGLYSTVIGRVKSGEPYYSALGAELVKGDYPTGSVFNWRPPTLTLMLAHARVASLALLVALILAVIALTLRMFYREAPEIMLFALLMQVGAAASTLNPRAIVLHEMWAGLCIALSVLLYAYKRPTLAALVVIAGLFVRELVAPYALVCALIAIHQRRRSEIVLFVVGGIAFLSFYAWHAAAATAAMTATAAAHPSWIQWGGPRFVLATIGFGGWLYLLPTWCSAFAAALLVASAWASTSAPHARIGALTYAVFFMVAGQQFNQYWGLLVAPTWSICYGLGVLGIVRLIRTARGTVSPLRPAPDRKH